MENHGENCCHGKVMEKSWNMKISQKVMEVAGCHGKVMELLVLMAVVNF